MLFSLNNQKVLITGASGSIGKAVALCFAEAGAEIVLSGTNVSALENVAQEIQANWQNKIHIEKCDLSDLEDTKTLIERAVEKMGGLDVLVNNAGVNKDMLLAKMTEDDLEAVLSVNLRAVFRLTKDAVYFMGRQRFGRVINMSSVVGATGNIGQANYCASKAAVIGMSKAIALECARKGVTVNCVAPGFVESAMTERLGDSIKEKLLSKIPMLRIGQPEDIAHAVCFLASKEAGYMTGQTMHINGGMLMA